MLSIRNKMGESESTINPSKFATFITKLDKNPLSHNELNKKVD